MAPRKGCKKHFPLNDYLQIKRQQDVLLVSAIARDREFQKKNEEVKATGVQGKQHVRFKYQIRLTAHLHVLSMLLGESNS